MPFLSRDSAKLKQVWLCPRCSLGWRVHPKMTALDAFGWKVTMSNAYPSNTAGRRWLYFPKKDETKE